MPVARRFTVKGRVQGVWFRDSARKVARSLGLTGHAINLHDGDVEVLAVGDVSALNELETWLHKGPPMARVDQVVAIDVEAEPTADFRIG